MLGASPSARHAPGGQPAAGQHGPSAAAGTHQRAVGAPPPAAHSGLPGPAGQHSTQRMKHVDMQTNLHAVQSDSGVMR